jgi:hypothetical protein
MLDALLMMLAIMVSADERREEKKDENIRIVGILEGTILRNKKNS